MKSTLEVGRCHILFCKSYLRHQKSFSVVYNESYWAKWHYSHWMKFKVIVVRGQKTAVPIFLNGLTFPAKIILFSSASLSPSSRPMVKRSRSKSSIVEGISNNQGIPGMRSEIIVLLRGGGGLPCGRSLPSVRQSNSVIALNSEVTLAVAKVRIPP